MHLETKKGYIFIKNNGLKHPTISTRSLGSLNSGKINILGRSLRRTWSLLAERAIFGMSSITLTHKPEDMVSFKDIILILCFKMEDLILKFKQAHIQN